MSMFPQPSGAASRKPKYEEDRSPAMRTFDKVCKVIAFVLTLCLWANAHILLGGGGYNDAKLVPVLGYMDSKVTTDEMAPEISAGSIVVVKARGSYAAGELVQYDAGDGTHPVSRVTAVEAGNLTLCNQQGQTVTVTARQIHGAVAWHAAWCYGFMKFYRTALGAAINLAAAFLLLLLPDLLMIKKRKAALEAHRHDYARRHAGSLDVKDLEEAVANAQDSVAKKILQNELNRARKLQTERQGADQGTASEEKELKETRKET